MKYLHCEICRLHEPTLRKLVHHYIKKHSKMTIIKYFLKTRVLQVTPNIVRRFHASKKLFHKPSHIRLDYSKSETLYFNDNINILCGKNDIIIADENCGMELPFSKLCNYKSFQRSQYKVASTMHKRELNNNYIRNEYTHRNSKHGKKNQSSSGIYHINIKKLREQTSLNEKSGDFYICHCGNSTNNNEENINLTIFTSDTESSNSDTGRYLMLPSFSKVFCSKCGNGYKSDEELLEHMKIHEMHCRVCNEIFPTEHQFKEHVRTHIFKVYACHICNYEFRFKQMLLQHYECHFESNTFETVLDMEEDYRISRYNFPSFGYRSSINSILCFLREDHEMYYYSYKSMKIICDLCYHELFLSDYEQHMQHFHFGI